MTSNSVKGFFASMHTSSVLELPPRSTYHPLDCRRCLRLYGKGAMYTSSPAHHSQQLQKLTGGSARSIWVQQGYISYMGSLWDYLMAV